MDTTISNTLHSAGHKSAYDAACKQLLSERIILAWILKHCVKEYRHCDVTDIANRYIEGDPQVSELTLLPNASSSSKIHGIGNEDASLQEGTVTYDIRFLASVPSFDEKITMIINLEAQNDFYPGYPLIKRALYYCCRMISSQYGTEFTGSQYGRLRKVYSIWVCTNPPAARQNSITTYSIQETPVIGQVQETPDFYDLISVVMVCLEKQAESEETRHTNDTAVHTAQPQSSPLLGLLNTLLSSKMDYQQKARILQDDYHIPMAQGLTEEVTHMTHIVDEIGMRYAKKAYAEGTAYGLTKGIAQGRTEGIAQGRTEGIAQGRTEGIAQGRTEGLTEGITQGTQMTLTDSIRNLMTALQFSTKQAMDILQVPEADRPLYEELLQKRELELASNESDTAQ